MTKIKYSVELQNVLDSIATLKALKGIEVKKPNTFMANDVDDLSDERVVRAKLSFQQEVTALIEFVTVIKKDKYLNAYAPELFNIISRLMEANEILVFENTQLYFRNKSLRKTMGV